MKPLYLYCKYREVTSGGDVCKGQENDPWPNYEDEYRDWSLISCHLNKPEWRYDPVTPDFKRVKVGDTVYVLYVRYTTGGTFITTHGAGCIVGIYKNLKKVEKIKKAIETKKYEGYKPWEGYFESFESCDFETMIVEN